jgi:hypothetical protein
MGNFVLRLSEGGGRSANSGWSTLVPRITGVRPRVNSTTGGFLLLRVGFPQCFCNVSAPLAYSRRGRKAVEMKD